MGMVLIVGRDDTEAESSELVLLVEGPSMVGVEGGDIVSFGN